MNRYSWSAPRATCCSTSRKSPKIPHPDLRELVCRYFADRDLVLVEGFSSEGGPCVLISRREVARKAPPPPERCCSPWSTSRSAIDVELSPDDIAKAADLLADHVRAHAGNPSPTDTGTP